MTGFLGDGALGGVVPDPVLLTLLLSIKVSGFVRVLVTRSEISEAPLGVPSPVAVLAVSPLEPVEVELKPMPNPKPPQNELEIWL